MKQTMEPCCMASAHGQRCECKGASAKKDRQMDALFEAHALLCDTYQCLMKPPSETGGRYEASMRVWNLKPEARDMMTGPEQCLYDALMKTKGPRE